MSKELEEFIRMLEKIGEIEIKASAEKKINILLEKNGEVQEEKFDAGEE